MTVHPFNTDWHARPKQNAFLESAQQQGKDWTPVRLPHDALLSTDRDPDAPAGPLNGFYPGGAFEYTKTFQVPEEWRDRRISLEFEGVYRDARVYLDRELVGAHHSGWTGFRLPLDRFLSYGEEQVLSVECIALLDSRKYTGAGIHRDVWLHVQDLVHLAEHPVHVRTPDVDEHRAVVAVATDVLNESTAVSDVVVRTELYSPAGDLVAADDYPVTVSPQERASVHQRIAVWEPWRWGPDHPDLYEAVTVLTRDGEEVERRRTRFGIRTLQVDPRLGLRLNGETVLLNGACLHGENGPLGAAAIARADERRIEILKDAGFNAVRIGHQAMSRPMLEACDRLGMLVMEEAFDTWTSAKADLDWALYFTEHAEAELAEVVRRDRNHPSVVMYSIGNEPPEAGRRLDAAWGRRLAQVVRDLDPDRFTTNAINALAAVGPYLSAGSSSEQQGDGGTNPLSGGLNSLMNRAGDLLAKLASSDIATEHTAESFAAVDIGGYNYSEGRFDGEADRFPHRVMVGSESGRGPFAEIWQQVVTLPNLIGDFAWSGWDYLGEVGIGRARTPGSDEPLLGEYPYLTGAAGDIDITGHRTACSYWREIVVGRRRAPYLAVQRPHDGPAYEPSMWGWTDAVASWTWDVQPGTAMSVEVYGSSPVELTLDGRHLHTVDVGPETGFRQVVEVPYTRGELAASGPDGTDVLRTATGDVLLSAMADRDRLHADDQDLAVVTLRLVDDAGTVWTGRDRDVTVQVSGAGVLQALGSGDPAPTTGFAGPTSPTFDGRVTAYVRPTGPGPIQVVATAEGVPATTLTLDAVDGSVGSPRPA